MKVSDVISDPSMSLNDWKALIDQLIEKNGPDMLMKTNSGSNNCTLELHTKDGVPRRDTVPATE